MSNGQMAKPSLAMGWRIFASRALSLVGTLIAGVVVSVVSFMLLLFPVVAGYYYAVSRSRCETYFIDLNTIGATTGKLFVGIKRYFFSSYVVGLLGLVFPLFLMVLPVLGMEEGQPPSGFRLLLMLLWIPACWTVGSVLLFGYPYLIATGRGFASFGYALSSGEHHLIRTFALGFLLCFPITAFFFHLLMVFSYPILVASALGTAAEVGFERKKAAPQVQEVTLGRLAFGLALAGVMVAALMFSTWMWGGVGIFIGIGFSFALALFAHAKGWL